MRRNAATSPTIPGSSTIVRTSLAEAIRQRLRDKILSGELAPGNRLTEQGVAEEMGTSAGPVREALARLAHEGLIMTLPHRGTFVSEVSEEEARGAYAIRARLEPYAFEQTMAKRATSLSRDLPPLVDAMRAAARRRDYAEMISVDMQFHGYFYAAADNPILASVWPQLEGTIRKFVAVAGPQYNRDLDEIVRRHEHLAELAINGDRRGVVRALADHGQDIWRNIPGAEETKGRPNRPR